LGTASYLQLALSEYLSMRAEMNGVLRVAVNLITGAFVVAGSVAAALAANVTGLSNDQRGILLEVVAMLGLAVYLTSIGFVNTFMSLNVYVTQCAKEINRLASTSRDARHVTTFQLYVEQFSNSNKLKDRVTWYVSYGVIGAVAVPALALVIAMALGGVVMAETPVSTLTQWGWFFGIMDLGLILVVAVSLGLTVYQFGQWEDALTLRPRAPTDEGGTSLHS